MSKPGERGFTWDSEDTYSNSDKIMVAEEKTEVARDELTVKDEVEDYVFCDFCVFYDGICDVNDVRI